MADLWNDLTDKLGSLAGKWTAYAALGSFLLYLFGYLALRFQLTTYGVATNLDAFDEKYLFAGCRFVVYLVSTVPNILIILLVLAPIGYLLYELVPTSIENRIGHWLLSFCTEPLHLAFLGVVLAVAFIQFLLRKCFSFGNLLLQKQLSDEWSSSVLLTGDGKLSLYYSGLVAGTLLTGAIVVYLFSRATTMTAASRFWMRILVFLFAVEFLLLPVNYGILISAQRLPRVAQLSSSQQPHEGERNWLLWDSKDTVTYFVMDGQDQRAIVSVPRKDAEIRIVAYDDIFCVLFSRNHAESRPCQR